MAVRLTKSEVQLLKELNAAGEHGRRIAATSSANAAERDLRIVPRSPLPAAVHHHSPRTLRHLCELLCALGHSSFAARPLLSGW
jgi:hypothetical protein